MQSEISLYRGSLLLLKEEPSMKRIIHTACKGHRNHYYRWPGETSILNYCMTIEEGLS